jgi:hypothetical protein
MSELDLNRYHHTSPARCIYCNTILDKKGKTGEWFFYKCTKGHEYYTHEEIKYTPEELLVWLEYKNNELRKTFDEIVNNLRDKLNNMAGRKV